jgi:hypothetical protein
LRIQDEFVSNGAPQKLREGKGRTTGRLSETGNCELLGLSKPNASGAKLILLDLLETRESLGKFDSFPNGFQLS